MAQRLEQTQAAVQTQQLSSLQVAVAKLVELPVTELATRVRDEMVDNAALEEKRSRHCGHRERPLHRKQYTIRYRR